MCFDYNYNTKFEIFASDKQKNNAEIYIQYYDGALNIMISIN